VASIHQSLLAADEAYRDIDGIHAEALPELNRLSDKVRRMWRKVEELTGVGIDKQRVTHI
jgi:hypothetical protein